MSEPQADIVTTAREFVTDIFLTKVSKTFRYHNLDHTALVVKATEEMIDYYQLEPDDRNALLVAAWFHDTGFSGGESMGHEAVSIQMATDFLKNKNADQAFIDNVARCIEATKMPQAPGGLLEQIICDADLFHLGTSDFKIKNEELREELIAISNEELPRKKWRKMNIAFMENHSYFTDYGRRKLQPVKEKHIAALKHKEDNNAGKKGEKKFKKEEDEMLTAMHDELNKDKDMEAKRRRERENQSERGISTVFRIMASNHAHLSQMADTKANIMISVNSIILSVVISVLIRHLDENRNLIIPTISLVLVCVTAIIYAVRATRPNISEGTFTKEDIQNKKTNLLFFGNFHNMTLHDYDWAMKEMLDDKDYLYSSMVKDLYFLGVVLAKKYRLLRMSYNIFMFGLIISILLYGIMISYETFFVSTTVVSAPITP